MVIKVIKSAESSRHPFFYNLNKVEQGEAELVAVRNIEDDQFGTIYRTLLKRDAMAIRTVKPSVHLTLSGDKGETLTDEQAVELIDKCMHDVGLAEQPYIIFRHDDTDKVHYHIVTTKVKEDGKSILWNGIGKRLVHSLAKYQDEYGYVASRSLRNKKQEESQQSGITGELNDKIDALIDAKNIYSVEMARKVLEGNGVEMTEFISKNTGRPMIKLRRTGSRPVYIPSDKTERLQKTIAENLRKIAEQSETFVIHGGRDATLYYNRPSPWPKNMEKLHEAARSILKYHTWGAAVRQNKTEEFVERAVKGQLFGTVKFNVEKARFIGENRSDGMLENPDEVIQFICYDGQPVDLFSPEFWTDWHLRLESLKRWIQSQLERKAKEQSVEKAPAPVQPQEQQASSTPSSVEKPTPTPTERQEKAPTEVAKPKPKRKPSQSM